MTKSFLELKSRMTPEAQARAAAKAAILRAEMPSTRDLPSSGAVSKNAG